MLERPKTERHINNSRMTHRKHLFALYFIDWCIHLGFVLIVVCNLFCQEVFRNHVCGRESKSKLWNIQRFDENNDLNQRKQWKRVFVGSAVVFVFIVTWWFFFFSYFVFFLHFTPHEFYSVVAKGRIRKICDK